MILNADDNGCVADGRWLRGISIPAGSNVMAMPLGALSGMDVGASISVPGAADMRTTIEKLPGAKEMASVAIAANTKHLMVQLNPSMNPFTPDHVGWRITVDGAGPNGIPLLTDIVEVGQVSGGVQVLTLDDPALTAVTFANPPDAEFPIAVANDGIRARLSDHARASVGPLQVAIQDRHVADGAMTVGSHILRSNAARFSRLDLDTAVTIEGAGHHVTTIEEVPDDTTVVLANPAHWTVSDGAAEVWRPASDSTPHLLTMLESASRAGSGPVEIVFGPGVYDFTCTHMEGALPAAIRLKDLDGFTLRGSGRGVTVLRLMPEQDLQGSGPVVKDTHVIMAKDCHDLTITKLTVHGAYLTMAKGGVVQMHGVFLAPGCEDVDLRDIEVFQSGGDGVRLVGDVERRLQGVRVDRCRLIQNHRSGVAVQREVAKVRIHGCTIDMTPPGEDACIDLEPTGKHSAEAPSDIEIDSNILVHGNRAMAVSLSGISPDRPARLIRFRGNTLTGGRVGGTHTERLSVLRNTIDAGDADVTGSMMGFNKKCVELHVEGNQVLAAGQQADGITLAGREGSGQVRVVDNVVRTAGVGIDVTVSGSDVEVTRNKVHSGQRPGIRVRTAGGTKHKDINVSDNTVLEFGRAGITVGPDDVSDRLDHARITGNTVDREGPIPQELIGIELTGRVVQWIEKVVEDNEIGATIPVKIHGPT